MSKTMLTGVRDGDRLEHLEASFLRGGSGLPRLEAETVLLPRVEILPPGVRGAEQRTTERSCVRSGQGVPDAGEVAYGWDESSAGNRRWRSLGLSSRSARVRASRGTSSSGPQT